MRRFRWTLWLTRLLFRLTLGVSVLLFALVLLAPLLDNEVAGAGDWSRLAALFAHDAAVRHTSVAAALGLLVTAWVFFRPPGRAQPYPGRRRPPAQPPPGGAGA
jgi:hypothetical protein